MQESHSNSHYSSEFEPKQVQTDKYFLKVKNINLSLNKIVTLSAGCAVLFHLSNAQKLLAYPCETSGDETTESGCVKAVKHTIGYGDVDHLNQPVVENYASIQWSTLQIAADISSANSEVVKFLSDLETEYGRLLKSSLEISDSFPKSQEYLEIGDIGDNIHRLQKRLNEIGFKVSIDGIFGLETKRAISAFQASQNLTQDGIVGPQTKAALFSPLTNDTSEKSKDTIAKSPSAETSSQKIKTELDSGIENTAIASSSETDAKTDSKKIPVSETPLLGIDNSVVEIFNPDGSIDADGIIDQAGDVVYYNLVIINAGNVTLTDVDIVDQLWQVPLASNEVLKVGEAQIFGYQYIVHQSDIDDNGGGDGSLDNEAIISSNQTGSKSDSESVPIQQIPALKVDKVAVGIDTQNDGVLNQAGDAVDYSIMVQNTGNQTLTNVLIDDSTLGNQFVGNLTPGENKTFNTQYILTQTDIDNHGNGDGDIDSTVTADSDQTDPVEDFEELRVIQAPNLKIEKRVLSVDESGALLP